MCISYQYHPGHQKDWEYQSPQNAGLQIIPCVFSDKSHKRRPAGASQVAGKCEEGERERSAASQGGSADAECSRPHDPHGEAADSAAGKT